MADFPPPSEQRTTLRLQLPLGRILDGGNDADRIEHGCHAVIHKGGRAGGSNSAFVDGGVRFLKYGRSTWPLNLWAVSDADRTSYAFVAP